jgi:hypothetical protein
MRSSANEVMLRECVSPSVGYDVHEQRISCALRLQHQHSSHGQNRQSFRRAKLQGMAEGITPSLLAALEQCKDLQTKLQSTIMTLEDHNDFLTDKCVQSMEQIDVLKNENAEQKNAVMSLSAENILLRQKTHALQQYQEKWEEIRKEVASLRRTNMQLESTQTTLHFINVEAKYHGMMRLSDKQSDLLAKELDKRLKTKVFVSWLTLLKNKYASVDMVKQESDRWQKKFDEYVKLSAAETQTVSTVRRELLAKGAELEAEKRNVHKLSNRVRQLALIIAGLQEQHNAELEKVVTDLSMDNIGMLASSDQDTLSKIRLSLSPARSSESPKMREAPLAKSTKSVSTPSTPRPQTVSSEKVELAIRECNEVFRQMARKQTAEVRTEDRRLKPLLVASTIHSPNPDHAVEIMMTVVLNVFAKWKLVFPLKKIGATCYEWKGKKWHLAVQSQVLNARVGAGYEEFLPMLCKELVRHGP